MRMLVTGAQRSGTRYLATVLRDADVDATHEGNQPGTGWRDHDPRNGPRLDVDVDVCWHNAWWIATGDLDITGVTVVHLVRSPLASIASSVVRRTFWLPRPSGRWAIERMPSLDKGSNVERCARYWCRWNDLAAQQADCRLRIEDVDADKLGSLCELAGVDVEHTMLRKIIESTPTDVNANERRQTFSWLDLPGSVRPRVRELARAYGYVE